MAEVRRLGGVSIVAGVAALIGAAVAVFVAEGSVAFCPLQPADFAPTGRPIWHEVGIFAGHVLTYPLVVLAGLLLGRRLFGDSAADGASKTVRSQGLALASRILVWVVAVGAVVPAFLIQLEVAEQFNWDRACSSATSIDTDFIVLLAIAAAIGFALTFALTAINLWSSKKS